MLMNEELLIELERREEAEGPGPRVWDATACCAAFQLGACSHTEGFEEPTEAELAEGFWPTWAEATEAWDPEIDGQGNEGLAAAAERLAIERYRDDLAAWEAARAAEGEAASQLEEPF